MIVNCNYNLCLCIQQFILSKRKMIAYRMNIVLFSVGSVMNSTSHFFLQTCIVCVSNSFFTNLGIQRLLIIQMPINQSTFTSFTEYFVFFFDQDLLFKNSCLILRVTHFSSHVQTLVSNESKHTGVAT